MKEEIDQHNKQMTHDKQEFAIYQGKCNKEIAADKKLLKDSIRDLDNIDKSLKALDIEKTHIDKMKNDAIAKEKEVASALVRANQAEESAKKKEDFAFGLCCF